LKGSPIVDKRMRNTWSAIILSPEFRKAYERAGSPEPITTLKKGANVGWFIGITLKFPKSILMASN